MGFAMKSGLFFMVLVMAIGIGKSYGTTYTIGDSAGWTNHGVDYKSWSASKVFHVGDVFLFVYNKDYHNVVHVSHKNFNTCNSTSPHKPLNSGNDSFTIRRPGHYYFICGIKDHCRDGQRVDIRVPRSVQPPTAPPTVSPPSQAPQVPPSNPPTVSPPPQAPQVPPPNPPTVPPPSQAPQVPPPNPPTVPPPSQAPQVPPSTPPTVSPPSQAPQVPPSNPPTVTPPSNPPTVSPPPPAPQAPPTLSPPAPAPYVAPVPSGPSDSSAPFAPVPAPTTNSGSAKYPGSIGFSMFLASMLIGVALF